MVWVSALLDEIKYPLSLHEIEVLDSPDNVTFGESADTLSWFYVDSEERLLYSDLEWRINFNSRGLVTSIAKRYTVKSMARNAVHLALER